MKISNTNSHLIGAIGEIRLPGVEMIDCAELTEKEMRGGLCPYWGVVLSAAAHRGMPPDKGVPMDDAIEELFRAGEVLWKETATPPYAPYVTSGPVAISEFDGLLIVSSPAKIAAVPIAGFGDEKELLERMYGFTSEIRDASLRAYMEGQLKKAADAWAKAIDALLTKGKGGGGQAAAPPAAGAPQEEGRRIVVSVLYGMYYGSARGYFRISMDRAVSEEIFGRDVGKATANMLKGPMKDANILEVQAGESGWAISKSAVTSRIQVTTPLLAGIPIPPPAPPGGEGKLKPIRGIPAMVFPDGRIHVSIPKEIFDASKTPAGTGGPSRVSRRT